MPNLGGWELVIILGILVLLFGAKKLPDMARSIGQSARVFKGEMKGLKRDDDHAVDPVGPVTPEPAAAGPVVVERAREANVTRPTEPVAHQQPSADVAH